VPQVARQTLAGTPVPQETLENVLTATVNQSYSLAL